MTAPAGATLDANTDYLVVFEGTGDAQLDFILGVTPSNKQDRGTRADWAIEDASRFNGGLITSGESFQISVNGSSIQTDVFSTWDLIPAGLTVGDTFRLLFLSSTGRNANLSAIGTYNTFVQDRAAAGHSAIQAYSSGFRAVGCNSSVDARDNTETTYTSTDKGVPIYWLGGNKAADDYEDFYDGSWDDEANDKNESGTDGTDTSMSDNYPWTGCEHDGTEALDSHALGDSAPASAIPIPPLLATAPFSSDTNAANINTVPYTVSRNSSRWLPPPPPTTHH